MHLICMPALQILSEQEQTPCLQPVILTQSTASDPRANNEEEEEDWQQLSALPQASGPSSSGRDTPTRTTPTMYIDYAAAEAEPMGFRELFLRSNALENLFAGKHATPSLGLCACVITWA